MLIFGEKNDDVTELKRCVTWFIYFIIVPSFIGYMWQILWRGPFCPHSNREQPRKGPSWIGLTGMFLLRGICDVLRDLEPFVQFKKREKHSWRRVTFSTVAAFKACDFTKSNNPPWVFFTFFKLYKWYQIVQKITQTNLNCQTKFTTLSLRRSHLS